jgi:hypothetical protein
MKEYQFQYTKTANALFVVMICFIVVFACIGICISLHLQELLTFLIGIPVFFFTIALFKKIAVSDCTARLSDTSVEFNFDGDSKTIDFANLISFKTDDGKNGPILYLKSNDGNFRIFANSSFCNPADFKVFRDDLIAKLDNYRLSVNPSLIHRGSIFATKGMLYFLCIATIVYLLAFLVENKAARLSIGVAGGFWLIVMWIVYSINGAKANE